MGYRQALEAAGASIKSYEEFGSYQGTWLAITEQNEVIEGSYGSCSGCDAFQSEFDFVNEPHEKNGRYYKDYWEDEEDRISFDEYERLKAENQQKLASFGQGYLNSKETLDEAIARYQRKVDDEWAWEDDKEILQWLKDYKSKQSPQ